MQISVDGFLAEPNGEEDWKVRDSDAKLWQVIDKLPDSCDTLLIGRKMAKKFIPHFESFDTSNPKYAFAKKMTSIPKVILSNTLKEPFGQNIKLANGTLADEIAELKNQKGKDILVYGGAGFVTSLIAGGHIDEFYFFINPVIINKGMRIFDLLNKHQKLSLISATPYACGVTVIHYALYKS